MDTCCICGIKRASDIRFTKLKDAWICSNCLKESALTIDYPDWKERSKIISRMTAEQMRVRIESGKKKLAEIRAQKEEEAEKLASFPVTTADLQRPYEVICPLFFQTSNKGFFSSRYHELAKDYVKEIERRREQGEFSDKRPDLMWLWFGMAAMPIGQNDFEPAFYIGVEELKKRAIRLGADAIVGLRLDFDLDTSGFQYFYLQMYGTAVKFID